MSHHISCVFSHIGSILKYIIKLSAFCYTAGVLVSESVVSWWAVQEAEVLNYSSAIWKDNFKSPEGNPGPHTVGFFLT